MRLLYPLGLLGLISIIILIIIYIIKPKYQEKKISSTFIWKLSLKYFRKKIPLQWLTRSLLFIIQALTLLLATILLTRPYLLKDTNSDEKIFIIENSASMQISKDNQTRLDAAISEVKQLSQKASDKQKVSIIVCADDATYLVYRESSPSYIEKMLDTIEVNYGTSQIDKAVELANDVLNENYKAEVILYTDNKYEQNGYVKVKNMDRGEWNASILNSTYALVNGYYEFKVSIGSFNQSSQLKVVLKIDGDKEYTKSVDLKNNNKTELIFNEMNLLNFTYAEVSLKDSSNRSIKDAYRDDNVYYLYGANKPKFKVEIIGENSIFTNAALHSLNEKKCSVYVPTTEDEIRNEGYDLYIFSGVKPDFIPNDGHIWLINPPANTTISELDLAIGSGLQTTYQVEIVNQSDPLVKDIETSMLQVSKVNEVSAKGYESLLEVNGHPLLLNKTINKQIIEVINIDLHYSTIAISINLPILVRNLVNETLNYTTDKDEYGVLEKGIINFKINCSEAYLNDELVYSSLVDSASINYQFMKPGVYIVKQTIENSEVKDFIFVTHPISEMDQSINHGILAAEEYQNPDINYESDDVLDRNEIYLFFALALLILLVVEWGVQYREQY